MRPAGATARVLRCQSNWGPFSMLISIARCSEHGPDSNSALPARYAEELKLRLGLARVRR